MIPRAFIIGCLVAVLVSWLGDPPPTWAQSPDDTHMPALNPNGCRSTDSDFPIAYRGHADPLVPAFYWILPEDPFDTSCGYLDRDADGLLDWAEAELAWVFRPYFAFHWAEEEAGRADDPRLNGFQIFYQIHPVADSMDNLTTSGPLTRLIRIDAVVSFRRDSTHSGDTESVNYELISHRSNTDESFLKWRLHAIYSQGCPEPSNICGPLAFETDTWVIATTKNGSKTIDIDYEVHHFPWNESRIFLLVPRPHGHGVGVSEAGSCDVG